MIRKTSEVHIKCTLLSKEVFPDVWSLPHEVCVSCPLKKNETPNVFITLLFCHEFRATSNNSSLILTLHFHHDSSTISNSSKTFKGKS